ncbi:MAG: DHH family phosphoesterase [Chitinophagaceae bacterium]|nr:DHH family phosphoesterase [Chitinophagaceae bacterium]MBL0334418.1 DHH family phosphoesterase [Chitinophagaceae bacterium]
MQPVQEIYPLLSGPARRIVITTHQKPDADAMGSSLALKQLLIQLGHSVTVISPTNWAGWVNWMSGTDEVLDFEADRNACLEVIAEAEWIFCLDYNHFARTKAMEQPLREKEAIKILIDHHQEPDSPAFTYGISDTRKSSTCEMIYDFIVESGHADKINLTMAECIYAGLVGDTGSFRFPSAHEGVHRIVAELKAKGLSHTSIHENLFDNFLENRLRFIGHVLMNRMEIFYEYNTALIVIPKSDLLRFRIRTGDTEGLVNYPQSIQGIKLVALVIDRDEERKWSFRSKGDFDCNKFARKYFNGGGHFAASGGHSADSLDQTVRRFKEVLKENEALLK